MNKTKKALASFLAGMTLLSSLPLAAAAAEPAVEESNGVPTVYLSSFGKISYDGNNHVAFRKLNDAVAALGKNGGRIVFTGTLPMSEFVDIEGRAPLTFIGSAAKASASVLNFDGEESVIELHGDFYFENCSLQTKENVSFRTKGNTLSLSNKATAYAKVDFIEAGKTETTYPAPFIISTGSARADGTCGTIAFGSGVGRLIAGGSYLGESFTADTNIEVSGGTLDDLYVGNAKSEGSFAGSSHATVSGGEVGYVLLGSDGGTTNANLSLTLSGGYIKRLRLGASKGTTVNGNVVFENFGGSVGTLLSSKDTVTGNVIVIDATGAVSLDETECDYLVRTVDASVTPVFEGVDFKGFRIADENGFIPEKVFADGAEISHVGGIFTLNKGKTTITVTPAQATKPNREAVFVAGYSDGTFRPSNNLTRAEAITLLSRLLCEDISTLPNIATCDYADVSSDNWFYGPIAFFERLGFLEKLESADGKNISPNAAITRGEFSELCVQVLSALYNGKKFGIRNFSDVSVSNPFYSAIGQLAYLGVSVGYEDGTFLPEKTVTRAEVVTMVNRMLGRSATENIGAAAFSDVESWHWANAQIAMACSPQTVGGVELYTVNPDISKGSYTLLSGDVTVGDQIRALREKIPTMAEKDVTAGIDAISKWQIANILNAPDIPDKEGGTTYYISSEHGNNKNDGLSPETAWQSLRVLQSMETAKLLKRGDTVRFERGGTYIGTLTCFPGVTYSAYGSGPKPVLSASGKNYASEAFWNTTDVENVYKLKDYRFNVGIMVFDFSGVLGNYNELVGDMMVKGVNGFTGYKDLYKDLSFYSDLSDGSLYLCSTKGNPGTRFRSIDVGAVGNLIRPADDVTIDNLTVRFIGSHGVGAGNMKNVTVQNCTFDYLGGSILMGFGGTNLTRYGNALQVYGGCDGWYLYNNWMYQIYDTGMTHQYNSYADQSDCLMDNVRYIGNVVELCHWSIEYYNYDYGKTKHYMYNTYIADNICRLNGYGWGSRIRMSGANLVQSVGIPEDSKNFLMENNLFDRSSGKIFYVNSIGDRALQLKDNLYVQSAGGELGIFFGTTIAASPTAQELLLKAAKDNSIVLQNDDTTIENYNG